MSVYTRKNGAGSWIILHPRNTGIKATVEGCIFLTAQQIKLSIVYLLYYFPIISSPGYFKASMYSFFHLSTWLIVLLIFASTSHFSLSKRKWRYIEYETNYFSILYLNMNMKQLKMSFRAFHPKTGMSYPDVSHEGTALLSALLLYKGQTPSHRDRRF